LQGHIIEIKGELLSLTTSGADREACACSSPTPHREPKLLSELGEALVTLLTRLHLPFKLLSDHLNFF
jgi:hypothetical protein